MAFYVVYNIISKILIGYKYKNNFGVELILFKKQCHVQNGEDACNEAYSVNLLNDSKLLDLGSTFKHCLSLGTYALIKNNTLSIFIPIQIAFGL